MPQETSRSGIKRRAPYPTPSEPSADPQNYDANGLKYNALASVVRAIAERPRALSAAGVRFGSGVLASEGMGTGAVIAGGGERLAQMIEQGKLNPFDVSAEDVRKIAVEAGIGALPFGATLSKGKALRSMIKGATVSTAGTMARKGIGEKKNPIDIKNYSPYDILPTVAGGGVSALFGRLTKEVPTSAIEDIVTKATANTEDASPRLVKGLRMGTEPSGKPIYSGRAEAITRAEDPRAPLVQEVVRKESSSIDPKVALTDVDNSIRKAQAIGAAQRTVNDKGDKAFLKRVQTTEKAAEKAGRILDSEKKVEDAITEIGPDPTRTTTVSQSATAETPGGKITTTTRLKPNDDEKAALKGLGLTDSEIDVPDASIAPSKAPQTTRTRADANKYPGGKLVRPPKAAATPPSAPVTINPDESLNITLKGPSSTQAAPIVESAEQAAANAAARAEAAATTPPIYGKGTAPVKGVRIGTSPAGNRTVSGPLKDVVEELDKAIVEPVKTAPEIIPPPTPAIEAEAPLKGPVAFAGQTLARLFKNTPDKEARVAKDIAAQANMTPEAGDAIRNLYAQLDMAKDRASRGVIMGRIRQVEKNFGIESTAAAPAAKGIRIAPAAPETPAMAKVTSDVPQAPSAPLGPVSNDLKQQLAEFYPYQAAELKRISTLPAAERQVALAALDKKASELQQLNSAANRTGGTTLQSIGSLEGMADLIKHNPQFAARLGLGAIGAVGGAAIDPLGDPFSSALLGAGIGMSAPSLIKGLHSIGVAAKSIPELQTKLASPQGVNELMSQVGGLIPHVQRFNYLMSAYGLPANAFVGPWGSGFNGALTKALGGDKRGWEALKLLTPENVAKEMWAARNEAKEMIRRADLGDTSMRYEGNAASLDALPYAARELLEVPARAMTSGDLGIRNILMKAGFTEQEAREMTLTAEPFIPSLRKLANLRRGEHGNLLEFMAPFIKTPLNILEQGGTKVPGLGFMVQASRERGGAAPVELQEQLVQQFIVGPAIFYGSYLAGANLDPETARIARRYITNAAGQYSLLATIGFVSGQQSNKRQGANSETVVREIGSAFPLPTAEPLTDVISWGLGNREGLPRNMTPAIWQEWTRNPPRPSRPNISSGRSGIRRRTR